LRLGAGAPRRREPLLPMSKAHRCTCDSLRTELAGGQGFAPRGQEEELRAAVMVANRQGFEVLACVWDVCKECCKCFMRMLQK
jgi:hypothetical protein